MLAAQDLLQALSQEENGDENYKDINDDDNFGDVLELYRDNAIHKLEVMCSDGQRRDLLLK